MSKLVKNPPDAKSLMESARSFGNYDLASAIADLIDNSITAGSKKVEIQCLWNDSTPEIRVLDDGCGMDQKELVRAMRPASTSPTEEREPNDLGRFGLGLKIASLSQCRRLTVVTKFDGRLSGACWDLDKIQNWSMEILTQKECQEASEISSDAGSGTEVIWTNLDRLTEDGMLSSDSFNGLINHARSRLAMVFHRYIEPEGPGRRKLAIKLNGLILKPFDPFHEKHPATQRLTEETVELRSGEKVVITPFILPHYSKMSSDEHETLAGEEGYLRNQGFYIYRNRRLIIHGTWFRLVRHGDLSKLARIRVDIPNSLDDQWKITVDKSDAQIPSELRGRLRALIQRIREQSGLVYRNRGARIDKKGVVSVWLRTTKRGAIFYTINRDHPVIGQLSDTLTKGSKAELDSLLKFVEQNFPIDTVFADVSEDPNRVAQFSTDPDELRGMTRTFIEKFMTNVGDSASLVSILEETDPFRSVWPIVVEELERARVTVG